MYDFVKRDSIIICAVQAHIYCIIFQGYVNNWSGMDIDNNFEHIIYSKVIG